MTTSDPRLLDLTGFDRPDDRQPRSEHSDLDLLRLVLDLQLDAMLLTLGAAAHAESRGDSERRTPWKRWLVEDLDLARILAIALVDGDGAPVPGLGGGLAHAGPDASLENLMARFENMENLLVGIVDGLGAGRSWCGVAGEALERCRARLAELGKHRRSEIATIALVNSQSLPGEWLG